MDKNACSSGTVAKRATVDHLRSVRVTVERESRLTNFFRSTYYRRPDTNRAHERARLEAEHRVEIEAILKEFPAYGYRGVPPELRRRGVHVNHHRVAQIMQDSALTLRRVGQFLTTTDNAYEEPVFTYLLEERQPSPGLVHHAKRGEQDASEAYRQRLKEYGIRGSITRRGDPYDNPLVENFFKTLKHEEILSRDYETVEIVVDRLHRFLKEVYNRPRLHSALGYMPPEEFDP